MNRRKKTQSRRSSKRSLKTDEHAIERTEINHTRDLRKDDDGRPDFSDTSRRDGGRRKRGRDSPDFPDSGSYLVDETQTMERERRLQEQQGHRSFAKVHAREHHEAQQQVAPEGELQNNILQNPWLDSQRFDGVDPNLNPEPPLNTEARREYDNQRREQEMEKQLRLGNMPKFSSTPKPQGP